MLGRKDLRSSCHGAPGETAVGDALFMLLPFFGAMMVAAVLSSVALAVSTSVSSPCSPSCPKLDPIKGA